jgi:hypothetical protein
MRDAGAGRHAPEYHGPDRETGSELRLGFGMCPKSDSDRESAQKPAISDRSSFRTRNHGNTHPPRHLFSTSVSPSSRLIINW